ncbi:hypothetical protein CBF23_009065 [Marinomonas agarivorans]|nr:hypothetical protein CBF23_009065 [Marinomonas agarivorans]
MNSASLSDYANIISALVAALSLLAPVLYTWLSQRARLGNTEDYVESLKLNSELKTLLTKYTAKQDPLVHARLKSMIEELEVDIKKRSRTQLSLKPFNIILFFEILIMMSLWLSGSSQSLTTFFEARSSESGIGFFEGVLQAPEMRLMIIILNVLSAAFINRHFIRKLQPRFVSSFSFNAMAVVIFHIVMVAVLGFTYLLLSTLDNYLSVF